VNREVAVSLLERLHAAQGSFYAGGPAAPLRALLATAVVWHVPGHNGIAGTYYGIDAVMDYFTRRRELAQRSFRMHPGEILVGDGEHVAVLTDGSAIVRGTERRWSTVGLYRFQAEWLLSCHLLPLDPEAFDEIWS
jgi:ketosteroid isomerase-like protein